MKYDKPVVKCYRQGNSLKYWCPFCAKWHVHGWIEGVYTSRKNTQIRDHCTHEDSPFKKTEIYLKLMTKKELAEIANSMPNQ